MWEATNDAVDAATRRRPHTWGPVCKTHDSEMMLVYWPGDELMDESNKDYEQCTSSLSIHNLAANL
jgi:hypothetical protein